MYSRLHRAALAVFIIASLTLAGSARAQTQTGSVIFEVTDTSAKPLSGVTITLTSPQLQGTQLRETDAGGRARFLVLPPGEYKAEFAAEGYLQFVKDVSLGLGDARVERVAMTKGALTENVTVVAEKPIDPTETATRQVYTAKVIQNTQLGNAGRQYQSILQRSPGVGGGANPSVHGATLGENTYLIDGVNTTDPVTGTFGLNTNFDAIDQLEFVTGGFQAEFGQATGGIVNQVTKSGGNEFHGSFDGRMNDERFDETGPHYPVAVPPPGSHPRKPPREFHRYDFTLGGPIVKDKAWFFLAYSDILSQSLPPGALSTRSFDGKFYLAKITTQLTPNHRLAFQYTADPATIDHSNAGPNVAPEAGSQQEQGANFFSLNYWGRLSDHWNITGQAGSYRSELNSVPLHDSGVPAEIDDATGFLSANYNDAQFSNRDRDAYNAKVQYVSSGERFHDVKFGIDHSPTKFDFSSMQPGGGEHHYYNGFLYQNNVFISAGKQSDTGDITALFLQDTFHATRKLTIDYGIRRDHSSFERDDKTKVLDLKLFQPRVGMAFDIRGDAKDVIRWSFARVMHPNILTIPNAVNAHGSTTQVYVDEQASYDAFLLDCPDPSHPDYPDCELQAFSSADCNGDGTLQSGLLLCYSFGGPSGSEVVKGTDPTYIDQFTLGYKHQIRDNMVMGVTLVANETKDIIEDYEDPNNPGHYLIGNPPTNLPTRDGSPAGELSRKYRGLELDYAWHAKHFHMIANYTLSSAKGNVEYTQGLGTDWDFDALRENRYGHLSYDRRHALKIYGWVDLPKNWNIGYDFLWRSGVPLNSLVAASPYGSLFTEPRGSLRMPSFRETSTEVRKLFEIKKTKLTVLTTITNLFNEQEVVTKRTRPTDHRALAWQQPRRWEVGLRFEF